MVDANEEDSVVQIEQCGSDGTVYGKVYIVSMEECGILWWIQAVSSRVVEQKEGGTT